MRTLGRLPQLDSFLPFLSNLPGDSEWERKWKAWFRYLCKGIFTNGSFPHDQERLTYRLKRKDLNKWTIAQLVIPSQLGIEELTSKANLVERAMELARANVGEMEASVPKVTKVCSTFFKKDNNLKTFSTHSLGDKTFLSLFRSTI